jgi:hypothetical protein
MVTGFVRDGRFLTRGEAMTELRNAGGRCYMPRQIVAIVAGTCFPAVLLFLMCAIKGMRRFGALGLWLVLGLWLCGWAWSSRT